MTDLLARRVAFFSDSEYNLLLSQGLRGVEREALRVTTQGCLATTPHPYELGSALTHAQITTDYSEALLEFITPAEHNISTALERLDEIHRFAYSQLKGELLWYSSMPCELPSEKDIPIAWYGTSHSGMFKHIYRRGLALRYGKTMQCIAGIHYNFSLNEDIWEVLRRIDNVNRSLSRLDYQSRCYLALIRNFCRYSWLLIYLFGASPALSKSFLQGRSHQLQQLGADTLFLPYATSLRMSDLGYQNYTQAHIKSHCNDLQSYVETIAQAIKQPHPDYEKIGVKRAGKWLQISTNILQIENEYYSIIRPKRVMIGNERLVHALRMRGIQYVEVRCLDIDPFDPLSISLSTSRFLDTFLHFLVFETSPPAFEIEIKENYSNFVRTAKEGRRPGFKLQCTGKSICLRDWGLTLLDRMQPIAALLDHKTGAEHHIAALALQRDKLLNSELTLSARVLREIHETGNSFVQFVLKQSNVQAERFLSRPLELKKMASFYEMARVSIEEQKNLEHTEDGDFDNFIANYCMH